MTKEEIYNDPELKRLERELNARAVVTGLEDQPLLFISPGLLSPRDGERVGRLLFRLFPAAEGHAVVELRPLSGRN